MPIPLRSGWATRPHPRRLPPGSPRYDEILRTHDRAVSLGFSMYRDPASGASVMTAGYLAERGYCCNSGCRHCPYVDADEPAG